MMRQCVKKRWGALLAAGLLAFFTACTGAPLSESRGPEGVIADGVESWNAPSSGQTAQPAEAPQEYRAVWLTYLEWQHTDFSSEEAFRLSAGAMLDGIKALGANTVIAQVRPFGDALYKSDYFPYSSLITGVQGQDPGYDPLAALLEEAHTRGLRLEAWINPYRIRLSEKLPEVLSEANPAVIWMAQEATAGYVHEVNGGLWFDPAEPEVQKLIVNGVREVVQNYEVDGIQFDDYFYPEGADDAFDQAAYEKYGADRARGDFRRDNVSALVKAVYAAVKAEKPGVAFGISPQGNNDNNYQIQYCDIGAMIAQPGYMDYVMPQLYWGYDFILKSGNDRFSYENCLEEWMAMPRDESVSLYVGLGAYRVGTGDGSYAESSEWQSGRNLTRMIETLREKGAAGFGLYRYDSLYQNTCPDLAKREVENLQALLLAQE